MVNSHRASEPISTYELSADESLSEGVVRVVASLTDLEPFPTAEHSGDGVLDPLYTVIDPDALDALFAPDPDEHGPGRHDRVSFPYHGYEVTVHSAGRVCVREPVDVAKQT